MKGVISVGGLAMGNLFGPTADTLFSLLIAVILTLSGTFEQVLTYMGLALGVFPILTVSGVFLQRKQIINSLTYCNCRNTCLLPV